MLRKTAQKGFTIVELLIVIVVIGILAALVLNTFSGVQARARDTERQTDNNSIATQLEVYYNDNGHYPTVANLRDDTWVQANLKGLDLNALRAPGLAANNITNGTASANKDQYGYQAFQSNGTTACSAVDGSDCAKFTLTYTKESLASGETNPLQKKSLN